jgi:hypothetical protein
MLLKCTSKLTSRVTGDQGRSTKGLKEEALKGFENLVSSFIAHSRDQLELRG